MLRRGGRGRLRSNIRRTKEDVNPMNYVSNLVDAMLVLAVGMMLALIVSWNLQISETGQVTTGTVSKEDAISTFTEDDLKKAEDVEDTSNLEEKGTVYYDKETDTYYIIKSDGTKTQLN